MKLMERNIGWKIIRPANVMLETELIFIFISLNIYQWLKWYLWRELFGAKKMSNYFSDYSIHIFT